MDILQTYGIDAAAVAIIVACAQQIKKYVRGAKRWMPWIVVLIGATTGAFVTLAFNRGWRGLPLLALLYSMASFTAYALAKPLRKGK